MTLQQLWERQREYNRQIKAMDGDLHADYWTQIYLLGLVSEIDEVLRDINWKRHRKSLRKLDRENLGYELADLMKYMVSLWEVWGFSHGDMLRFCHAKSEILEELLRQEHRRIPRNQAVLITDIDGTLGDWRASFIEWLETMAGVKSPGEDLATSIFIDADLSMRYPEYYELKNRFESEGGYEDIIPYPDAFDTILELKDLYEFYVIAITARPVDKYQRIWLDTWNWLTRYDLEVDELVIGNSVRVLIADLISRKQSPVIMFEDNPDLAVRAANTGVKVFLRRQPYNESVDHPDITVVDEYNIDIVANYLKGV